MPSQPLIRGPGPRHAARGRASYARHNDSDLAQSNDAVPWFANQPRKRRSHWLVSGLTIAALVGCFAATDVTPAHADALVRTLGCGANLEVLNTGYNAANGTALAIGSVDPVWLASGPFRGSNGTGVATTWSSAQANQMIADPTHVDGISLAATRGWTQAFVGPMTTGWQPPPASFSKALGLVSQVSGNGQLEGSGGKNEDDFGYLVRFNLDPAASPKGVTMRFSMMGDNTIAAIFVNGVPQTGTGLPQSSLSGSDPYYARGYETAHAAQVNLTGFQAGVNTILAQVKSGPNGQSILVSTQGAVVCNPVIEPDAATVGANESTTIAVMTNDGNLPDGAKVSQAVAGDPAEGSWTVNSDNTVTFTPARDFVGTATATYTVVASNGTVLGSGPVTVRVDPAMGSDVMMTSPGVSVRANVLDNDVAWPGSVVSGVDGDDPDQGVWSVDDDGLVRFTPADGFAGAASATYTVTGPDGQTATASVAVEVLGLSLAASRTPEHITAAGQEVEFRYVLTNTGAPVSGAGLDQGVFTGTGMPSALSCSYDADGSRATNGSIQLGTGESVTCVARYVATQADIDSGGQVSDAMGASAHGSLGGGKPQVPVAADSQAAGADVGQAPELSVDVDTLPVVASKPGDPVWFEVTISNTGNVTMSGVGLDPGLRTSTGGPVTVGTCTYDNGGAQVPAGQIGLAPGESAKCLVSYPVTQADLDAGGGVSFAASATGTDPNGAAVPADSPAAQTTVVGVFDGSTQVPWNTPASVDVIAGVPNLPAGSTLTSIAAKPGDRSQDSWWSIDQGTGQVRFTPPASFSGVANGIVTITYPDGTTGTQPVSVTVLPPPVSIQGVTGTTPQTDQVRLTPQVTAPAGSAISVVGDPSQGAWTANQADRTLTFTPRPDFVGVATATITVTGPDGTTASAQASVAVTRVPEVDGASAVTPKDTPVVLRPVLSIPSGSVVTVEGDPAQGSWVLNPDNTVTFTPAPGFIGTANATMIVTFPDGMTDAAGLQATVTATPIVDDASGAVLAGQPVTLVPQIVAPAGSVVTVEGDPAEGSWTVNTDNTVTFTPAPGFTGTATAVITVTAPDGTTDSAVLDVEVSPATDLDGTTPSPSPSPSLSSPSPSSPSPSAAPQDDDTGDLDGNTDNTGGPASATGGTTGPGPASLALAAIIALTGTALATTGTRRLRPVRRPR